MNNDARPVHFMNGKTRATPCEKAYLNPSYVPSDFALDTAKVTCTTCLEHPIYLDALAARMEELLK